jgi:hypothetical protein
LAALQGTDFRELADGTPLWMMLDGSSRAFDKAALGIAHETAVR